MPTSKINAILEDIRNARAFVLVDSSTPDGEEILILPAQYVTPSVIAEYESAGRAVLQLAIPQQRAKELALNGQIGDGNTARCATLPPAGEAGGSAIAKARAVAAAINPSGTARDIESVQDVLPVVVHDGGALVRPGHAEAAVDLIRLAGLMPAAAIWSLQGLEHPSRNDGETIGALSCNDFDELKRADLNDVIACPPSAPMAQI